VRRYHGFFADSARWERFRFRDDDIVISTPSKCGTTWMQSIVGSLVLDRPVLGVPISTVSPWLDMLIRTDDEVFGLLDAQQHRRWIKTHTPLDGLPRHPTVTYIAVIRHPLDVALSDRDHRSNTDQRRALELRTAAVGAPDPSLARAPEPLDVADYLRWFIDNDVPPTGSGPNGLADFCQQATTYWEARNAPNVHLFHYTDLWESLADEMRLVANALDITVDDARWSEFVEAATLDSMRDRAADTAPDAHVALWRDPHAFFRAGGPRDWASLLTHSDIEYFNERLGTLARDATPWVLTGRTALTH
jgi:aryl sulfotransferase